MKIKQMRLMQTLYTRNFNQWKKRSIPFVDENSGTFLEESSRKPKPKHVKIKVSNNCEIQTPLR